jgi:hypothetical protein
MYYNTMFVFKKKWMERAFISHVMAMGYKVERVDNTPAHIIFDTSKEQQDWIRKWATYSWTC